MLIEPILFSSQCVAALGVRSEDWPPARCQIGDPLAMLVRLDMRATPDRKLAQLCQVDSLAIQAGDLAIDMNDELHRHLGRRRMLRRGRSTSRPSTTDCTPDSCVVICWRSAELSRSAWGSTPRVMRCAWL